MQFRSVQNLEVYLTHLKQQNEDICDNVDLTISQYIAAVQIVGSEKKIQLKSALADASLKISDLDESIKQDGEFINNAIGILDKILENPPQHYLYTDFVKTIKTVLQRRSFCKLIFPGPDYNAFKIKCFNMSKETLSNNVIVTCGLVEPTRELLIVCSPNNSSGESCYSDDEEQPQKKKVLKKTTKSLSNKSSQSAKSVSPINGIPDQSVYRFFYAEVKILQLVSVDRFYIRLMTSEHVEAQSLLLNDMNQFYNDLHPPSGNVSNPNPGFKAAVLFEDKWRRCVIDEVKEESCDVFLVDLGCNLNIELEKLKTLPFRFWKTKQDSIHCKLGDVAPKRAESEFSERCNKKFRKLALEDNLRLAAFFTHLSTTQNAPHSITLYAFPGNGLRININTALVKRLNCLKSTGPDSSEAMVAVDEDQPVKQKIVKTTEIQKSKRIEVKILHIVNPSMFFVALKHREPGNRSKLLCSPNSYYLFRRNEETSHISSRRSC